MFITENKIYKKHVKLLLEGIMKKLFVFPLILLFAASAFAQGTEWFKGTFDEAKAKAEKEGKLILLDLTSGSS